MKNCQPPRITSTHLKIFHCAGVGWLVWFVLVCSSASSLKADVFDSLEKCNVSWDAPGASSADSMPLGNGDIALNVWTETNGDMLFYVAKSDAWSEDVKGTRGLLKLGRVRVSLTPNPFRDGKTFRQTLRLVEGEIQIKGGVGTNETSLRIWVDANQPVVRVEADSVSAVGVKVTLDPWRTQPVGKISADVVLPVADDTLVWYHRNGTNGDAATAGWTFGAALRGEKFIAGESNTLHSVTPQTHQVFAVFPLTTQAGTVAEWRTRLTQSIAAVGKISLENSRAPHRQWWRDFWQRSWIFVGGDARAKEVTRGYVLQRFITACAGRGAYPVKYNGSLFTVDSPATARNKTNNQEIVEDVTADFRYWGGQYWFQNTRPMYWARLKAGDFDLMQPLFKMYSVIVRSNAALIKEFYGHEGSYFTETAPFWGGVPQLKPEDTGSYTRDYFTPVLELSAMMLDYHAFTGDEKFLRETLLPAATAGITFFDQHWKRDAKGRLLLDPDNSIEMFWRVRNPLPDIAGLHYVLGRLLELPAASVDAKTRARWQRLLKELPAVPTGVRDGKNVLLPFEEGQEAKPHNTENPELYAIYPFRLYGVGKPDFEMARDTFARRVHKRSYCWHQDAVQAAFLGLADVAQKNVTEHFTRYDKRLRFPAFWEKGHDYAPDEDNGGNGELALQTMLLQADGGKIFLLPAWPKNWSADFKLHAPLNTTVEGRVENGKIKNLKVTPESRTKDVVMGGK